MGSNNGNGKFLESCDPKSFNPDGGILEQLGYGT